MERNRPNYLVITLVLILIGVYGYFSNKKKSSEAFINEQSEIISDQHRLIRLYELYFLTIQNSQNPKLPYPSKDDTFPINRSI